MLFEDTNLDLPTLAGSGTPKFLGVVIFKTTLQKFGEFPTFFHRWQTKMGKNYFFHISANYSNAKKF